MRIIEFLFMNNSNIFDVLKCVSKKYCEIEILVPYIYTLGFDSSIVMNSLIYFLQITFLIVFQSLNSFHFIKKKWKLPERYFIESLILIAIDRLIVLS